MQNNNKDSIYSSFKCTIAPEVKKQNILAVIGRRTNWHRVRMQRLLPVHTEPARPLPISHDAAGIVEDLVGHRAADNERRGLHERVPRSFEKVHSKASVVDRILQ